jgi:hypothetical protein
MFVRKTEFFESARQAIKWLVNLSGKRWDQMFRHSVI